MTDPKLAGTLPRLAIIDCSKAAYTDLAKKAACALSGRILLAASVDIKAGPVASTGFDFMTLEAGPAPADYPALLAAANVTPEQTVIVQDELALAALQAALPHPVRYRVFVETPDADTGATFLKWVTKEHAPELLALPGCSEYRICKVSEKELACEYLFTSENALQTYYQEFADTMRSRYKLKFPAASIRFTREDAIVAGCGFKREAADYSS